MKARVEVGELIYIREPDYKFGLGRLWLRVQAIIDDSDPEWVQLKGIKLAWNGARLGEFDFWVRKKALDDPRAHASA